jgi:hypothetical protein
MWDCQRTEYTAFVALRLIDALIPLTEDDLESARRHLQLCPSCSRSIPAESRARFVVPLTLEEGSVPNLESGRLQESR